MKKIWISLILALMMTVSVFADEYKETDPIKAAGYYHSDEFEFILLPNGISYRIIEESINGPYSYSVFEDENNFIINVDENTVAFIKQKEKEKTETGGIYYAGYMNFAGMDNEIEYKEGKQVRYGNWIFDNDYDVFVRDSLSYFYGIDETATGSFSGKMEGDGFDTPEEAASAYINGLKNMDINQIISTYAVETYVENYSLEKNISRLKGYSLNIGYIPDISDFSIRLNTEKRRADIVKDIRYQYLILTDSEIPYDGSFLLFDNNNYDSPEDFVNSIFATDDNLYFTELVFDGTFIIPEALSDSFATEATKKVIQTNIDMINADDIKSVAAYLKCTGRDFILTMDTARYEDKWYVLNCQGTIGIYMGISTYNGGLKEIPKEELDDFHVLLEENGYKIK